MDLDLNVFRALYTVIMLVLFLIIVWWAYSRKRKVRFHEASQLPFNEPEHPRQESRHE